MHVTHKNQKYLCRKFTTCCLLRYCNGLFIHYKTSEGVLHGEFKQTYVITIQSVLEIIKELAGFQAFSFQLTLEISSTIEANRSGRSKLNVKIDNWAYPDTALRFLLFQGD